ncbi:MAG: tRNA-dihydrouridine synthase [Duodenibacillus sp.]|nr:tRNA-dihydrouridine synthase [Duodenibacillus sp.]
MEGLTGFVYRRVHSAFFAGADEYWVPFVTPTAEPRFTERQLRELAPGANAGRRTVPQLLTRHAADFIWAARELERMGYPEVNLNAGCPAGTVVAKGKGAGMLRTLSDLDRFLDAVFSAGLAVPVSIKARLGWASAAEFGEIARILCRYPASRLVVHARLKTDMYRGEPRWEALERALPAIARSGVALGLNGDVARPADIERLTARFPDARLVMAGRGLAADPALFRRAKGGEPAGREEIAAFSQALFEGYAEAFGSWNNALQRMKEHWFYWLNLFDAPEAWQARLFRAKRTPDFLAALEPVLKDAPWRAEPAVRWKKPL